ncbi:MAG TPA: TSCPD domain-containing protein, partial [Ruminiclostridium sp.]|nr:TSCPD domain-containing protein [Ruminiclostridium sp.]
KAAVKGAIHFLDNVIDANKYPLPEIDKMTRKTRKVGLGIMGWADMLLELGIPYNSDEAVELAGKLMKFITNSAREKSAELAVTRGAFPIFDESTLKDGPAMRNATVTTIAPTGTLSIIAGCSSGVEPVFAYVFIRNVMDGTELIEVNPVLEKKLRERGLYSDELMKKIAKEGSLALIPEIPDDIKRVFVCAHDISPEYHIRMQAAFQNYTENAVSKTVNFANSATRDDVREVYMLAYKLGCKGVTIYRDGSRDAQVLNIGKVNTGEEQKANQPRPRPDVTTGFTEKVHIGCGNLYITVNYDENGICEVFTNTGRAGGCPSQSEATARLVSIALRSGMDTDVIIEQLKGIRCPSTIRQKGMKVTSCPDAIARVIEKVKRFQDSAAGKEEKTIKVPDAKEYDYVEHVDVNMKFCPECGQKLEHEGGCVTCRNCGYSKCG